MSARDPFLLEHHERPVHELVLLWESDLERGLTSEEAGLRRERFGPNVLPPNARHGPLVRFLLQFHNPLIYVLLGAAAVTLAIGDLVDSAVILGVVLVNAVIGFVQEWRAGEALEALAAATRTEATVVRDGRAMRIDSRELVPGDVVQIEAGDKVPADLRLAKMHELRIDESALTGESVPVSKTDELLPSGTVLGDRTNMAYASTLVTAGSGRGLAVATGVETEIGRIHQLVGQAAGVTTPLTQKLTIFSRWLTIVILALAAVTFAIGVLRGEQPADMVTAAVALAVGAIPEGLPAAVTITLAIGVSRMARRHAIIRKLPAAETLGSTTVICTDKTGTLTQNRMTVQYVMAHGAVHDLHEADIDDVRPCLVAGVMCNDASLSSSEGTLVRVGDPTELALLSAAAERGLYDATRATGVGMGGWPRVDVLPFASERRLMATTHEDPATGRRLLVVKGAAEEVLSLCADQRMADGGTGPLDRVTVLETVGDFGASALRVLAFAAGQVDATWAAEREGLRGVRLTFIGLQAMADPPRPEAIRAVAACHRAGVRVTMITGDHARTAAAVAMQLGLHRNPEARPVVRTGAEITEAAETGMSLGADDVDVFARVSAEQKLDIVQALQGRGDVVAMTGDGINDAPALKQADIGIAMGMGGTEVAKEASDLVLTDDNFASIEAAIEEGRSVFDNLTKFIAWTLPTNLGEGLVVLVAIVTGVALPILPVQILWINMTTAVALGLMLAFEPGEPDIMTRPPRAPGQPILTRTLIWRILLVGAVMLAGAFGLYEWATEAGYALDEARTVAVNAFVAMEIGYLFNCRALDRSLLSVGLLSNRLLLAGVGITILLQIMFTYLPGMNAAFQTAPLPAEAWVPVTALGVAIYGIVGVDKWFAARRVRARRPAVARVPQPHQVRGR
jgi:cation-transporting ATPase F